MRTKISCCRIFSRALCVLPVTAIASIATAAPELIPQCRLDDSAKSLVLSTLAHAATAFKEIGKSLPFDDVKVNEPASPGNKTLVAYVITDENTNRSSPHSCAKVPVERDEPLDPLSVRGGCILVAVDRMEIRCSASAIRIFGDVGQKIDRANPSLLYVLSHELGHLYQRRVGEYAGRAERIDLSRDRASKLKILQDSCDPASTHKEEEADAIAVEVLSRTLALEPYREPLFSAQGSLYWNIDQLAIASSAWQNATREQEFMSQLDVHKAFVPTEFPTSTKKVNASAHRFVCEVLTKTEGSIYHPLKSITHPPVELRLQRIAEALQSIARKLPDDGAQRQFIPIARLQTDLGPIFTQIYRETGLYMEAVQASICSQVNMPTSLECK